jgi:putative modified peptide
MPFNLGEQVVDRLLGRLESDDDFRELFRTDPRAALAQIGHLPAEDAGIAEGIWACCVTQNLASKEEIRNARVALRIQLLSSQASLNPITLESRKK